MRSTLLSLAIALATATQAAAQSQQAVRAAPPVEDRRVAGAVRYTQYSLMVFGHARIPIMGWMREQVAESLTHAATAGEEVTSLGGQVSLGKGRGKGGGSVRGRTTFTACSINAVRLSRVAGPSSA